MAMMTRWIFLPLIAGIAAAGALSASAQPKAKQQRPLDPQLYNEELTPGQIQRAQDNEPSPGSERPKQKASPKQPAQPARAVACSGNFAKDSSHLKLATAYKSENVEFMEVESG